MRVHELAKELNLASKDLIKGLTKLRVPVKGPMSVVDDETVAKIRQAMAALRPGALKKPAVSKPAAPKKKVAVVAAAAPAATRPTTPLVAAATPRPAPAVSTTIARPIGAAVR